MKVIFLNTWHGEMHNELHTYVKRHLHDTDVFCFQESTNDDRGAYELLLADGFELHTAERQEPEGSWYNNVMYVRSDIPIINKGGLFTTDTNGFDVGIAAYVTVRISGTELTICNVHGVSVPGHKLDTAARLYQSKTILDAFNDDAAVIIGGDFNLLPETQSVQAFAKHGYRNLISEFDIKSTRNYLAYDKYPENIQHYADYAFVSAAINVIDFTVPSDIVSDHQPLELTYNLQPLPLVQFTDDMPLALSVS